VSEIQRRRAILQDKDPTLEPTLPPTTTNLLQDEPLSRVRLTPIPSFESPKVHLGPFSVDVFENSSSSKPSGGCFPRHGLRRRPVPLQALLCLRPEYDPRGFILTRTSLWRA
jgi:hypothetical protein